MKVLAAGVSLPDVLAREGVHPENTARALYARLGPGRDCGSDRRKRFGIRAWPDSCRHADQRRLRTICLLACLPQSKLIPVPAGLDPAEAVVVVLNYITAYQMLHRSAKVKSAAAEENQAADRTTVASLPSAARTRITRKWGRYW